MNNNIQDAIEKAKAAAGEVAQTNEVVEAHVAPNGQVTTFTKPSMAAVQAATGVIPRSTLFLKVNEFGLRLGTNKDFFDGFPATVLMVEDEGFQVKHTIRFGNPAQYLSTYDGIVCDKGGSWQDAMQKANMADPSAMPYQSVDVVLTLTKDLKLKETTIKAGTKIGFNSSKTNFSEWVDFYTEINKAGRVGEEVKVKIGAREINHNGNNWGVVTFEAA